MHDDLEARERELLEQLQEVRREKQQRAEEERRRKEEERKRLEAEKEVKVVVKRIASGVLIVQASTYREDVITAFRDTPGRRWRPATQENSIPLAQWEALKSRLEEMDNVEVAWAPGMEDQYDWHLNAPPFEVSVHRDKEFKVKPGPNPPPEANHLIRQLEGASWSWETKDYVVPFSEGHKVYEVLKEIDGVVFTDDARERIVNLVEKKAKLDIIAQKDDIEDFEVSFPPDCELRPFQKVGVVFAETAGGRALIADEMGLGKTWEAIAFAQRLHENGSEGKTLVVCKAGLREKWWREIKDLTGESAFIARDTTPGVYEVEKLLVDSPRFTIISYTTMGWTEKIEKETDETDVNGDPIMKLMEVQRWPVIMKRAGYDLMIVDESHYIKNPDTNRSKAVMVMKDHVENLLHLTGTPVLNRPGELWPILHTLDPGMFPMKGTFMRHYATGDGRRARNVERLREVVKPFMIRRTKADVMKDLPMINRITELHSLSDRAQRLYDQVLQGVWEEIREYNPRGHQGGFRKVQSILAQITRLKQICAIDKASSTADLATEIIDQQEEDSTKKVLVFTHFKAVAVKIAQLLGHEAICTVKRTKSGFNSLTATERDQLFEDVRNRDDIKFVVTTEAAKEGHNLDYCYWTIFNDLFWTPASHEQCEGRAYGRLNNPHAIDSYYMVTTDPSYPIEEWLMKILKTKMRVFEEVVEGVESARDGDESVVSELIEKMRQEMWRKDS